MNDILSQIIAYSPNKIDTETKARAMVLGPRNMYAGGQLVQPSADGSRPGYAEDLPNNVYKNKQGNYVYRSGSGEDRVYKSGFKTPDAASKWGQKEFVKKFSLPNKFVNAGELGEILGISKKGSGTISPFFERSDRPNYLLQEARKILGSYKTGKSNFFRAPTKKEIEYLKKYNTSPIIPNQVGKNVQLILNSKAIMNDLTGKNKDGKILPDFKKIQKVFSNAGIEASDAVIANALQKAAYLLRGDSYQTNVNFNKDKATGNFIIKEIEKLPFDNQYTRGIYKHALQEISKELGDTAGNLDSFKRNFKKRLPKDFLEKHNLNVNEIFSVRASVRNKSYPYAYFIDVIDADINQKALRAFHGALSNAQTKLNNKIKDVRAGKAKYDDVVEIVEKFNGTRDKFKETIKTNYPNKPFNLPNIVLGKESEILKSNMKIPADVYSKKLLDKWQNQGLDITGHAKKTGYVMTGAADEGVFTAQDLSRNPEIRNKAIAGVKKNLLEFAGTITDKCKIGNAEGGRIGFKTGSADCLRIAKEGMDEGLSTGKWKSPDQAKMARNIAETAGKVGKTGIGARVMAELFGPVAIASLPVFEAGIAGYDTITSGTPFNEAINKTLLHYALGDKTKADPEKLKQADILKMSDGPEKEMLIGLYSNIGNLNRVMNNYKQKAGLEQDKELYETVDIMGYGDKGASATQAQKQIEAINNQILKDRAQGKDYMTLSRAVDDPYAKGLAESKEGELLAKRDANSLSSRLFGTTNPYYFSSNYSGEVDPKRIEEMKAKNIGMGDSQLYSRNQIVDFLKTVPDMEVTDETVDFLQTKLNADYFKNVLNQPGMLGTQYSEGGIASLNVNKK